MGIGHCEQADGNMLHILHISIFDKLIDCRTAFGDSQNHKRSDPESQALPSLAHSRPQYLQQPPAIPSHAAHADLNTRKCRKVMHTAGGPNYESVLRYAISIWGQIQRTSPASDVEEQPGEPI